jgi:hypothetical protein
MPQQLWPADAYKLMQLLRTLEIAGNPADLATTAAYHRYDLSK